MDFIIPVAKYGIFLGKSNIRVETFYADEKCEQKKCLFFFLIHKVDVGLFCFVFVDRFWY